MDEGLGFVELMNTIGELPPRLLHIDDQECVGPHGRRGGLGRDSVEQLLAPMGGQDRTDTKPGLEAEKIGVREKPARRASVCLFPLPSTIRLSIALWTALRATSLRAAASAGV